ncbi:MAG: aminopeptidase N, partial [Actinobacteria bacterium]|nr:aminopeptidase N [Actinomycetota bacterium]
TSDADALKSQLDRWVEELVPAWSDRDQEEALLITEELYPSTVVSRQVVAAADRALALDLPTHARRLVTEARDGTLRALRARASDAAG